MAKVQKKKETKLAIRNELNLLADGQAKKKLSQAIQIANLTRKIITEKKLFCEIKGNKYVYVKGWKLIGSLLGLVPEIDVEKTKIEEKVQNYEKDGKQKTFKLFRVTAVAYLRDKAGNRYGTAIGLCSNTERNWIGRDETAIIGMAQTRAIGRVCKNALDWLVTLAGYEDVPVEEVSENSEPVKMSQQEKEELEVEEG